MNSYDILSRSCHKGPKEVYNNLFLGSEREIEREVKKFDCLVPLYCLGGDIWKDGFRGEILYYPTPDYGVLSKDVAEQATSQIINRLNNGRKVAIFCFGGHGRTGYLASIVLGKLGIEDPIKFLRNNYCDQAVESNSQIEQISEILRKPQLFSKYETKWEGYYLSQGSYYGYNNLYKNAYPDYKGYKDYRDYKSYSQISVAPPVTDEDELILFGDSGEISKAPEIPQSELIEPRYCCDCRHYVGSTCKQFGVKTKPFEEACDDGKI